MSEEKQVIDVEDRIHRIDNAVTGGYEVGMDDVRLVLAHLRFVSGERGRLVNHVDELGKQRSELEVALRDAREEVDGLRRKIEILCQPDRSMTTDEARLAAAIENATQTLATRRLRLVTDVRREARRFNERVHTDVPDAVPLPVRDRVELLEMRSERMLSMVERLSEDVLRLTRLVKEKQP